MSKYILCQILGFFLLSATLFNDPVAWADWVEDLKSPVTTDARYVLLSGTGVTLAVLATHKGVEDPFDRDTATNKPLGSTSKYGDIMGQLVPNVLYASGMLVSYYVGPFNAGRSLSFYRAKLMFEASLYAGLVTTVLKYTIREPRPYDSSVRNSFPSGHATTAFAFAGVITAEHGWAWGAPAMALASFVAYSRINDNQHNLHDVVAGATVGLTCAYGIYYAQASERQKIGDHRVLLFPTPVEGGVGLSANWTY